MGCTADCAVVKALFFMCVWRCGCGCGCIYRKTLSIYVWLQYKHSLKFVGPIIMCLNRKICWSNFKLLCCKLCYNTITRGAQEEDQKQRKKEVNSEQWTMNSGEHWTVSSPPASAVSTASQTSPPSRVAGSSPSPPPPPSSSALPCLNCSTTWIVESELIHFPLFTLKNSGEQLPHHYPLPFPPQARHHCRTR